MSPLVLIPPSAIRVASLSDWAQSIMDCSVGIPCPVWIRVEQMEPPPIPTRIESAPQSAKSLNASRVATLPAIICISSPITCLNSFKAFCTLLWWPCATSMHRNVTPARVRANALSIQSSPIPIAAPIERPLLVRFITILDCSSILLYRWRIAVPPDSFMAMAMASPVIVSIGLEMIGKL